MANKDLERLLKKYPHFSGILQNVQCPVRGISVKPITRCTREGTEFSYNSGYNYYSNTIKMNDIYVEFFDIWQNEEDRDTRMTVYVSKDDF